ncbi:hypothetical protein [Terrarubrum flagellatum]|uniref:hypothetical protein n=1 Tax=Terrirubrum flagellatum TaxID=2895980 RepID=UPI00314562CE
MAKASLKGAIITQTIAALVFVGAPILITLIAPFTDVAIQKTGSTARVAVTRYVLMFIPWQKREIEHVKELRADVTAEFRYKNTAENRRMGRAGAVSHSTGQFAIVSDGPEVVVQASPELAVETEAKFDRFMAEQNPAPLRISVYASWWLSYVLGGVATAFAALYLCGAFLAIVTFPFKTSFKTSTKS